VYSVDIAAAALESDAFRRVLHTTGHLQLVVMTLAPGEDIGADVHEHNDQLLTFVEGLVLAELGDARQEVGPGEIVVVPAGTEHNFTNVGLVPARLYTVYGPPDHAPGTVHETKAEAEAAEAAGTDQPPPEA